MIVRIYYKRGEYKLSISDKSIFLKEDDLPDSTNGRKKDHSDFNCEEDYEHSFVFDQYGKNKEKVKDLLQQKCDDSTIKNFTHSDIYNFIEKEDILEVNRRNMRR